MRFSKQTEGPYLRSKHRMREIEKMTPASGRAAWPETYRFGDFVRLIRSPNLWGRIVAPSELPGRWMLEYPQGARVTVEATALERFHPSAAQSKVTERRFEYLSATYGIGGPIWPERYTA